MLPGRAREIARVDGLLAAARAGSGGTLVIRGEPGIGKTSLVARFGAEAPNVVAATTCDRPVDEVADGVDVIRAEFEYATTHEGALSVDDVLDRRTRIGLVAADRAKAVDAALNAVFVSFDRLLQLVENGGLQQLDDHQLLAFLLGYEQVRNRLRFVERQAQLAAARTTTVDQAS